MTNGGPQDAFLLSPEAPGSNISEIPIIPVFFGLPEGLRVILASLIIREQGLM